MIVECKIRRPFMMGRTARYEPNEYYRHWLEENVGIQGQDWEWNIAFHDIDTLEICFATSIHATLFELTWARI